MPNEPKPSNIGFFNDKQLDMETDLQNLKKRTEAYREILKNTETYRAVWDTNLREMIKQSLKEMNDFVSLGGEVEMHERLDNLEAVQFTLGSVLSGMKEEVAKNVHRTLIKHNGSLVYQQLFNGKIMVVINYPFIEGYGQPLPPKNLAIYRPEELKLPYLIKHMEQFIHEITLWEDFDDDEPREANQAIGFKLNFDSDHAVNTQTLVP
jgi:hypothetical protein